MKCKTCGTECNQYTAKTEKNMGKKFWSCPKKCKGWNGWVLPSDVKPDPPKPAFTTKSNPNMDYAFDDSDSDE